MVFAYALMGVRPFRDSAVQVLQKCEDILVPDSMRSELVNVVWQWIMKKNVDLHTGMQILSDADSMISLAVPSTLLWEEALRLACEKKHSAYDTLFVALAVHSGSSVVSFDSKLKRSFSDIVVSPSEYLGSAGRK